MKKMIFAAWLLLIAFAVSCAPARADPIAVLKSPARAEIVIEKNGCEARGVLTLGQLSDTGERELELTLTAPESVRGTVIKRTGGQSFAERSGISFETDAFDGVMELFLPGASGEATVTELDGVRVTRVAYLANGRSAGVYLNGDGQPVLAESDGISVRIVWLETEARA